jgi:uncharacterized membrane protein YphA (DoxX/SURF4 family)
MEQRRDMIKNFVLTAIRMAVGWHFLFEGFSKLFIEEWSSKSYLANATGFLSGFYQWLAGSDGLIRVADLVNVYGLILIGLALFLGLFIRIASVAGVLLLVLYYFAYPPFGTSLFGSGEGHYYIVNRNFIEAMVLLWFMISTRAGYGVSQLLRARKGATHGANPGTDPEEGGKGDQGGYPGNSRREALKNLTSLPLLGALGWGAFMHSSRQVDVMSGATIQLNFSSLDKLKGELPKGKIGPHEISRLVAGGNLIGGWAHSRDLIYGPSLFKAYNTEKKIYETLMLAEQAGINTINIGFPSNPVIEKYKKATGSRIKVISQIGVDQEKKDYKVFIDQAIDFGVDIIQVTGNQVDWFVRDGNLEPIGVMLDHIRSQGYVAGLGAHTVDSLIACEEHGIIPDYYMKTMHHDNYWSAHPAENRVPFEVDGIKSNDHNRFHDNLFCLFPERTIDFVNRATIPVMGFKVLAAGAIEPKDGFHWAFVNGADFICVGMFDFQVVDDVNTTIDVLSNLSGRKRDWYG